MIRQAAALLGLVVFVLLATANGAGYRYGASDQAAYIPTVILAENPGAFHGGPAAKESPRDRFSAGERVKTSAGV